MLPRFLPARLRLLWLLLLAFLIFNAAVRLGLVAYNGQWGLFAPWRLLPAMAIGALFDVGAATFFIAPLGLIVVAWPDARAGLRTTLLALLLPLVVLMVFVGASEFTFWNEFASRFNFIAVDYLIYTNEVIGNIRESYNLPLLLTAVGLLSLAIWWAVARALRPYWRAPLNTRQRLLAAAVLVALPFVAVATLDARYKEFSDDAQANEIAGNGYFDFWHAFWTNEIDYDRFYKTLPAQRALATLANELARPRLRAEVSQRPFDREIVNTGPKKLLNVVLVSVESYSAEFMAAFGNKQGLTPYTDKLAAQGLLFTQIYATGTRTVRGLEALTLSVPPTPGHSIVKRPDNGNLFTVGEIFKESGYEPLYLYGGYGYFDNMNAFFAGNGYTVIDRTALKPEDIHFENIWGVADEDLFTLTLRELDKRYAAGVKFFAHVMTTTNHRPFTYPDGRIDIAVQDRPRWRRQVHRLGDWQLHRARACQTLVCRHPVRDRRRPHPQGPRTPGTAARELPHPADHLRPGAHSAGPGRHAGVADRCLADRARPAELQLPQQVLRPRHLARGQGPWASLDGQLPDRRLLRAGPHRRVEAQWPYPRGRCRDRPPGARRCAVARADR